MPLRHWDWEPCLKYQYQKIETHQSIARLTAPALWTYISRLTSSWLLPYELDIHGFLHDFLSFSISPTTITPNAIADIWLFFSILNFYNSIQSSYVTFRIITSNKRIDAILSTIPIAGWRTTRVKQLASLVYNTKTCEILRYGKFYYDDHSVSWFRYLQYLCIQ